MSSLLDDITVKSMDFEHVCQRVNHLQPGDPLKDYNLKMDEFSKYFKILL